MAHDPADSNYSSESVAHDPADSNNSSESVACDSLDSNNSSNPSITPLQEASPPNQLICNCEPMLQQIFQSLEDFKVQSKNSLKAITKSHTDIIQDLKEQLNQSNKTVQQLQRRCNQLEDTVKQLKLDKKLSSQTVVHNNAIPTVLNKGRYARMEDRTPDQDMSEAVRISNSTPDAITHGSTNESNSQAKNSKSQGIRLHSTCTGLLLGDSNLKNISQKRLCPSKNTQVRTYHEVTIPQMSDLVQGTRPSANVKRVVFSVGTYDICKSDDTNTIVNNYATLLQVASRSFPSASIAVVAVPPQTKTSKNRVAKAVNSKLAELSDQHDVEFLSLESLWESVVGNSLKHDSKILTDGIHLSDKGLGMFLREVKPFLFPDGPNRKIPVHQQSSRGSNRKDVAADAYSSSNVSRSGAQGVSTKSQTSNNSHRNYSDTFSMTGHNSNAIVDNSREQPFEQRKLHPESGYLAANNNAKLQDKPLEQRRWPPYFHPTPFDSPQFMPPSMYPPYPYPPMWYPGFSPQRFGFQNYSSPGC